MEDFNRNTRTLIVSFVVAIFALIPLRFVEAGYELNYSSPEAQVLGESDVAAVEIVKAKSNLEEPYNEIENRRCIEKSELIKLEKEALEKMQNKNLNAAEKSNILENLKDQEMRVCEN